MYIENELPIDSPLTLIPVEMPVDVLVAYPEYVTADPAAPRFYLIDALATLLGRFGWENAAGIIRPRFWAPGWSPDEFERFSRASRRGDQHAFSAVDDRALRADSFLGHAADPRTSGYVQHEIVHFFGRTSGPLALDLGAIERLEADKLQYLLAMARTRLLILHVPPEDMALASELASELVSRGLPAVLVVAGTDQDAIDEYYTNLYAGIIHNTWLTEAARPPGGTEDLLEVELIVCRAGRHILTFHEWLESLRMRYRSAREAMSDRFKMLEQLRDRAAATMHEAQRTAMQPRMQAAEERTELLAEEIERNQSVFESDLDWAHESGGAEPLSRIAGTVRELEEETRSLESLYPELEQQLDEEARHAPRVLNAGFADPEARKVLGEDVGLIAESSYDLLVDVGPVWDKIPSLVTGHAEFPSEMLPPDVSGYRVDVVLVGDDFEPPVAAAEMWVPRLMGRSSPIVNGETAPAPGPVALRIAMPPLHEIEGDHREVRGRLSLYYENNVLQSAVVIAQVVRSADVELPAANEIKVDYRLTGTLRDAEANYARRTLRLSDAEPDGEKQEHRVAMNLTVNGDGAGAHRIVVRDRQGVPPARTSYDPIGSITALQNARRALLDCFWERDAQGLPISGRNGIDERNGKPWGGFLHDLYYLAMVGHQLYGMVFQGIDVEGTGRTSRDWDEAVQQVLARGAVIQVARTASTPGNFVFPWALLYDYPLPGPKSKYTWCKVLTEEWPKDGERTAPLADGCPHHDEPWHRENVLCPYGFWGLKHVVEQPISVLERLADAPREIRTRGHATLSIGKTSDAQLDLTELEAHLEEIAKLQGVQLAAPPPNPAADREAIRSLLDSSALVYFLCHGEYDDRQKEPYLGIGLRDATDLHRIYPSTVISWARTGLRQWPDRHPLVMINGCHTSDLQPGEILNFVSAFGVAGAGGAIGTEISVRLPVAVEVARRLFAKILREVPMGQAMREVRWELANKGNLLGLAYTAYGLADLRLKAEA